ncbi:MAG TPA: hypothetical protein PKD66_06985 [Azonexus sp.]|mgnify:FL=1|nr:hypothetical protein [Azonexus sp.]
MNNPNPENPPENPVAVVQPLDNRRRLRELLSIPERDRTDEQWDEIIELEIQLAPGNRVSSNEPLGGSPGRNNVMSHGKPGGGSSGGGIGQQQKKNRPRTNNNRRPRQNKPPSGGGQSGGGGTPA